MRFIFTFFIVLWLCAAVSGVVYLARYENTPAAADASYPSIYPLNSRIVQDPQHSTLIFFAHPKCPCTRASLHELARLMLDLDGKLDAYVVFSKPKDADEGWTETDLYENARAIPNVHVVIDLDNRETDLFGAQTSGLTLVYDQSGTLRFNGGITGGRGHEGDNAGRSSVFDIVNNDASTAQSPVFGCPIHQKDCPGEMIPSAQ
jgi:hypothetical protein